MNPNRDKQVKEACRYNEVRGGHGAPDARDRPALHRLRHNPHGGTDMDTSEGHEYSDSNGFRYCRRNCRGYADNGCICPCHVNAKGCPESTCDYFGWLRDCLDVNAPCPFERQPAGSTGSA